MAADSVVAVDREPARGLRRQEARVRAFESLDHIRCCYASGVDEADVLRTLYAAYPGIRTHMRLERYDITAKTWRGWMGIEPTQDASTAPRKRF